MANAPPIPTAAQFNWNRLLHKIARGEVIPIIGPELFPYHESLAVPLAKQLGIAEEIASRGIVGVADEYAKSNSRLTYGYELGELLKAQTETPKAISQLAGIEQFRLFITTDYASFIEQAIRENGDTPRTLAFVPKEAQDLERYPEDRVVYHLFGQLDQSDQIAL